MAGEKIYMSFGDIKGEVTEEKHKNWIQLHSIEFSSTRNVSQESGSPRRNIGSATISKIVAIKNMDNSTPSLLLESIAGSAEKCVIHYVKGGSSHSAYMEIKLENAIISKYLHKKHDGRAGAQEEIEISFTEIRTVYTPTDAAGKPGIPMASGFDIAAGKRI